MHETSLMNATAYMDTFSDNDVIWLIPIIILIAYVLAIYSLLVRVRNIATYARDLNDM